jgi:uncharacterized protein involved in copper resistance
MGVAVAWHATEPQLHSEETASSGAKKARTETGGPALELSNDPKPNIVVAAHAPSASTEPSQAETPLSDAADASDVVAANGQPEPASSVVSLDNLPVRNHRDPDTDRAFAIVAWHGATDLARAELRCTAGVPARNART